MKVYLNQILLSLFLLGSSILGYSQPQEVKTLTESETVTSVINPLLLNHILRVSIIVFIISSILLFLLTLLHRKTQTNYELKSKHHTLRYENFLAIYLADDDEIAPENEHLFYNDPFGLTSQDFKDKQLRRIFKQQIINLYTLLIGEEAKKLQNLYIYLGFDKEVHKKITHRQTLVAVSAIRELRKMNITASFPVIYTLISHKNKHIALEAMLTWVTNEAEPFAFLSTLMQPLSDWQQANLFEVAIKLPYYKQPSFDQWLTHQNNTVVFFALQCVYRFNQDIAPELLDELCESSDKNIQQSAQKMRLLS